MMSTQAEQHDQSLPQWAQIRIDELELALGQAADRLETGALAHVPNSEVSRWWKNCSDEARLALKGRSAQFVADGAPSAGRFLRSVIEAAQTSALSDARLIDLWRELIIQTIAGMQRSRSRGGLKPGSYDLLGKWISGLTATLTEVDGASAAPHQEVWGEEQARAKATPPPSSAG